jgi:hypothetical protein
VVSPAVWAALIAIFVVPVALLGAWLLFSSRKTTHEVVRFIAAAASADLVPGAPASLSTRAASAGTHAVWLDLELIGLPPRFRLDLAVTLDGVVAASKSEELAYDSDGDLVDAAERPLNVPVYGMSFINRVTFQSEGRRVRKVQRVELFTARAGANIEVRATLTPGAGTAIQRCRLLVTSKPTV